MHPETHKGRKKTEGKAIPPSVHSEISFGHKNWQSLNIEVYGPRIPLAAPSTMHLYLSLG